MLRRYDDCLGHCVCYADAETGLVEHRIGKVTTRTHIAMGETYTIEKEGTVTVLRRTGISELQATSYFKP